MSGIPVQNIMDTTQSHVESGGYCDTVNAHEPKNAPGRGLSAALWVARLDPLALASGLSVTSMRLTVFARFYMNMLKEPLDGIDPAMVNAAADLMIRIAGDFTLGGNIRNVDIKGQFGTGMFGEAGYQSIDGKMFRIYNVTIPCIVNDVLDETP